MKDDLQVEEYLFANEREAKQAEEEKRRIEYLQKHMNMDSLENVRILYEQANKEGIFRTPVGIGYLAQLRARLVQEGIPEEELSCIRLRPGYLPTQNQRREGTTMLQKRKQEQVLKQQKRLWGSVFLNILLALAVVAMFLIALNGKNPNILNYERNLQNQYAAWKQELTEREAVVRELEKKHGIE